MTDRNRLWNYYERDRPYSRDRSWNTMTEINHAEGIDHQSTTKITIKERIILHFRTMEIWENIRSLKRQV